MNRITVSVLVLLSVILSLLALGALHPSLPAFRSTLRSGSETSSLLDLSPNATSLPTSALGQPCNVETPARGRQRFAVATLLSSQTYVAGAVTVCRSMRNSTPPGKLGNVDIIALSVQGSVLPGLLEPYRCFDRVIYVKPLNAVVPPSFPRFKDQYTKLRLFGMTEYAQIVYMDSDFVVEDGNRIVDLLGTAISFGAVRDIYAHRWAEHVNGGFLLLRPWVGATDILLAEADKLLQAGAYEKNMAEQGFLSSYYRHDTFILPTTYNLNLALMTDMPDVWNKFAPRAVAIHYTTKKPWDYPNRQFPFDRWWSYQNMTNPPVGRAFTSAACLNQVGALDPRRVTIVTAYYVMKSKHSVADYERWIRNFLKLEADVYLFTDVITLAKVLTPLLEESGKANIHVCVVEKSDFFVNTLHFDWKGQHAADRERGYHSPELYQVWSEKIHFVYSAIRENPFRTSWFAWVDIGSFRGEYDLPSVYASFPTTATMTPGKVHISVIKDLPMDARTLQQDGLPALITNRNVVAGTMFFGDRSAFLRFHEVYYNTLNRYYRRGDFVGKDQLIYTVCYILVPDLFSVLKAPEGAKNAWFYPQLYYSLTNVSSDSQR